MSAPTQRNRDHTQFPLEADVSSSGPELSDDELEAVVGGLTRRFVEPIALGTEFMDRVPSMFAHPAG